ncbi:glycosyltransferase [Candidatus Marinimicrobia bacterium]|nr:glycosyltransferase [Candidatus Neomarinimicrobiota bacterium]
MPKPLVSINMLTYNQQEFITEAIKGVLMQKTNFPFKLVIGEDCSTDGTREIVYEYLKNYPKQIKVIASENNVGSRINELRTLEACTGKYIAFCEGDDYWTDIHKLQKQVDFLEGNPDYGLVHGDVDHLDDKSGEITRAFNKKNNITIPNGDIFDFLMKPSHSIKTTTVCIRKEILEKYYLSNEEIMQSDWALIDISIWLTFAYHSKIYYLDEVMATYRLLQKSMSRNINPKKNYQFHQLINSIRTYFINNYDCSDETRVMIETNKYKSILSDAYGMNDIVLAKSAMRQLKNNDVRIGLKLRFRYLAVKFPFIKYLIDLFR